MDDWSISAVPPNDVATHITGIPHNEATPLPVGVRHAMPTLASLLPMYTNCEADFINSAFSTGAMHNIQDVPATIKAQAVIERKQQIQEAAQQLNQRAPAQQQQSNMTGTFSEFEYVPSSFDSQEQQQAVDRSERRTRRLLIGGREFIPVATHRPRHAPWLDGFLDGVPYPYLTDPYEAQRAVRQQHRWEERQKVRFGPFVPGGASSGARLAAAPTAAQEGEIVAKVAAIVAADWPDCSLRLYVNDARFFVLRVRLEGLESERGLSAYMALLLSGHPVVRSFQLTKVVQHWGITPGDGHVYYAMRPPWVAQDVMEAFLTLHPEERSYQASVVFRDFIARAPPRH